MSTNRTSVRSVSWSPQTPLSLPDISGCVLSIVCWLCLFGLPDSWLHISPSIVWLIFLLIIVLSSGTMQSTRWLECSRRRSLWTRDELHMLERWTWFLWNIFRKIWPNRIVSGRRWNRQVLEQPAGHAEEVQITKVRNTDHHDGGSSKTLTFLLPGSGSCWRRSSRMIRTSWSDSW